MDWKLYTILILVLIISSIAGFYISKNIYNKPLITQVIEKDRWRYDTTYVTKIIKQVGIIDTIYIKDSVYGKDSTNNITASIDTSFTNGQDSFKLGIKYYYLPINKFEYSLAYSKSIKEIYRVDTVTVKETVSFWQRWGLSTGIGIMIDEKLNVNRGLFIGFSYKIL